MDVEVFGTRSLEQMAHEFPPELIERGHISANSLKTFMRCPETFRRRYMLGEKEKPAGNLLWGSADHAAIEFDLRRKMETQEHMPVNEVQEVFVADLEDRVNDAGGVHEVDWGKDPITKDDVTTIKGRIKAFDATRVKGQVLAAAYREQVSPTLMPLAIEHEFKIDLAPIVPVPVMGRVDLVAHVIDPFTLELIKPGPPAVIDRKTSAQRKRKADQEWVFQGRTYQLAFPKSMVRFDVSVKNVNPLVVPGDDPESDLMVRPWAKKRTVQMMQILAGQIGYLYARFGPDHPWTGAWTHPWACGYCGFKRTCFWFGGKGTLA